MKKIAGLLILIAICFTSCDNRKTVSQSLAERIEEFKTKREKTPSKTYKPEFYKENSTDTILSNGFLIKLKTFTNMQQNIKLKVKKESNINNEYHREIEGLIAVQFKNTAIFNQKITKHFISTFHEEFRDRLDNSVLRGIWLNQAMSMQDNIVNIDIEYCAINTNKCETFNLIIRSDGYFNVKSIKEYIY